MSRDLYGEIDRDSLRERLLKYTRKAFKLLPRLDKPRILDAGCGSGLPTIELAKLSNGRVVGIDIDQSLLTELDRRIGRENLSDRVETRKCSMLELDFPDEAFDIVWFEGATRLIGFEKALKEWRRLLKPNGFLVIHDEIKTVSNRREEISSLGYKVVNQFFLPEDAWWIEYYRPLENRIKGPRKKYGNNREILRSLRKVQDEIDMV
jgi:ubiquinone/menaquinone biosynthesis C-methylase UbiE